MGCPVIQEEPVKANWTPKSARHLAALERVHREAPEFIKGVTRLIHTGRKDEETLTSFAGSILRLVEAERDPETSVSCSEVHARLLIRYTDLAWILNNQLSAWLRSKPQDDALWRRRMEETLTSLASFR
jgi:hypothetical protein